jgi:hypothetical protein
MAEKLEIVGMDVATMTEVVRKLENKGGVRIGLEYLPFYESATEETMWDVVRAASPIASFRAVDGEAELGGKMAFDRAYADVVSIARKERMNTSDLRKIKEAGMLPVVEGAPSLIAQFAAEAKRKIAAALERSKMAIDNRLEWMQINALLGKISYIGKINFDVDYGIPNGQTGIVPTILWSSVSTATPLEDIQAWQELMLAGAGIVPDTIIMSRKAMNYIRKNTLIQAVLQYTQPMLSIKAAKQFIEDNTGLTVVLYDTTYTAEDGSGTTRFLTENTIIMLPSKSVLPEGLGDTARVAHPLAGYTPGYYTWQKENQDPYGLELGVGLDAFPRIKHPEALLNAVVFA